MFIRLGAIILVARCFAGPSPYDVNPDESGVVQDDHPPVTQEAVNKGPSSRGGAGREKHGGQIGLVQARTEHESV